MNQERALKMFQRFVGNRSVEEGERFSARIRENTMSPAELQNFFNVPLSVARNPLSRDKIAFNQHHIFNFRAKCRQLC
jgi:hypothetical protein